MIIKWIIIGVVASAVGSVILFAIVYVASGIQAKAWLDVFSKFLDDKLKKE
jgi:ABC-type multidrug transport system permease subunit